MSQGLTDHTRGGEIQPDNTYPKQQTSHKKVPRKVLKKSKPVYVVLCVRHSVLLYDALRWQVGDRATEAISADVISP